MNRTWDRLDLVLRCIAEVAIEQEPYFCDLDAVAGDGDFGYTLARGFEVVLGRFETLNRSSVGAYLQDVSSIIIAHIGGTSGPIWGSAFGAAGTAAGSTRELSAQGAVAMLRASVDAIKKRGGANVGDKTLLDALVPAIDALGHLLASGATAAASVSAAAVAARAGADETATLEAKRGRAAYLGRRSIGSVDAGAVAIAVMFEEINTRLSALEAR